MTEKVKCSKCGKTLVNPKAQALGQGHLCARNLAANMYEVSSVPQGYITVAKLHIWCVENNIAVSRLVKAFGRDRGAGTPALPATAAIYFGKVRYAHEATMKAFLQGQPVKIKGMPAGLEQALGENYENFCRWTKYEPKKARKA